MAKSLTTVTNIYQTVATGAAIITIETQGTGTLYLDEAGNDATAYKTNLGPGEQFEQTAAVDTQVRASGDGWVVIADGTL